MVEPICIINDKETSQKHPNEYSLLTDLNLNIRPKANSIKIAGKITKQDLTHSVAVIGSRKLTEYGQECCDLIVKGLVANGITIISGLMYGADLAAHTCALANGGRTIAVLGYGFGYLNRVGYANKVALSILEKNQGAVISEFEDDEKPSKWSFPKRNRIVSGLSNAVLVIEAGLKSGTFITVDFALEQGKDIFAVPGSIFSASSLGTNYLIKEGASMATCASDILEKMGIESSRNSNALVPIRDDLPESEKSILEFLLDQNEPIHPDYISGRFELSIAETFSVLSNLESKSLVRKNIIGLFSASSSD